MLAAPKYAMLHKRRFDGEETGRHEANASRSDRF